MRNLKKFLALVLAFVMAMSLMVTVNAANSDFTDSEDVNEKFEEAVDVLTHLNILKGYDMGDDTVTFQPGKTVTRAEMAALVYRLASGDADESRAYLYAGGNVFSDVTSDKWYDGVVGYCATYGIIAGVGNNRFNPVGEVTGYQALAMILRAVGYDQNGEFTNNPTWQSNVAQIATVEGLLSNVNSTSYAGKLSEPATRELIAEFLFQGAQIPTVTYTSALGYNKYTSLLATDREENPTLAEKGFGLAKMTGIIVGNQATGETVTKLGVTLTLKKDGSNIVGTDVTGVSYLTATANTSLAAENTANASISFETPTTLDMFGHKVDIWYKAGTNDASKPLQVGANTDATTGTTVDDVYSTVYCVRDLSTKTAVVYADDVDLTGTTAGTLGKAATDAGFTVDSTGAYASKAFEGITTKQTTTHVQSDGTNSDIWLLISNSATDKNGKNQVDVVVSLDIGLWQVQKVNNFSIPKTVTIDAGKDLTADTSDVNINRSASKVAADNLLVYGEDDIAVNAVEVVNKIVGTNRTATGAAGVALTGNFYGLNKITEKKVGTVTAISSTGKVTVTTEDGSETIERSALWNLADANNYYSATKTDLLIGNRLTFWLDGDGKYIGVEKDSNEPIMGAYAYWQQNGISGIKYYIQGVTRSGEEKHLEITADQYYTHFANAASSNNLLPYLATSAIGTTGSRLVIQPANPASNATGLKGYSDYTVSDAGVAASAGWKNFEAPKTWVKGGNSFTDDGATVYLTENTKFHVVSGYGDDLKIEHFTGLSDLLQGADSITVAGYYFLAQDDTEHAVSANNIVEEALLVNTKRVSASGFFFNPTAVADTTAAGVNKTSDNKAVQLEMYQAGQDEAGAILVSTIGGDVTTTNAKATVAGVFYQAEKDKDGYWELTQVADNSDSAATKTYAYYSNTTGTDGVLQNAGTAFGDIKFLPSTGTKNQDEVTIHAADATVIDATTKDHGITDYATLRRAAEENAITVAVLLTAPGSDTASVIYVTAVGSDGLPT